MRWRRRFWLRGLTDHRRSGRGCQGAWAFWLEPARLTVLEQTIELRGPAPGTLRVAVLTDLHVGSPFNGIAKLREIVDRTNAARPELICILGDLVIQGVIGGRFVPPEDTAAELKRLRAPKGVFAVLGNHDGWLDPDALAPGS
jgi:predicted MPP superfamily phosphohydrolase